MLRVLVNMFGVGQYVGSRGQCFDHLDQGNRCGSNCLGLWSVFWEQVNILEGSGTVLILPINLSEVGQCIVSHSKCVRSRSMSWPSGPKSYESCSMCW